MPNIFELHKIHFIFSISLMALFISCTQHKQPKKWDTAKIDSTISKDPAFAELDQEMEIFSMHEKRDSTQKRSSGVAYIKFGKDIPRNETYAKFNNCRAYFAHSDTLSINIGIGTGFGGQGFVIRYDKNKFYTQPYWITDVITEDEPGPVYQIQFQQLTLNRSNYKVGDSLYGSIDFKSIEIMKKDTIEHTGKGFFRTIVQTYQY